MGTLTITDELAREVLDRLSVEVGVHRRALQYEMQDNFRLLFISISAEEFTDSDINTALRRIAGILHELMPVRDNDYSWVVGVKRDGIIVESSFGGNAAIPDWNGAHFADETS